MRTWLLRSLLVFALVTVSLAAFATRGQASPRLEGLPESIHAGEVLDIGWSDLPEDADEVELEISIDGGRWKRISRERDAYEGHFEWKVPTNLCGEARLRLRYGGEDGEHAAAPSAPFTIVGESHKGPARPANLHSDDQWTSITSHGAGLPSELAGDTPHLNTDFARVDAELPSRSLASQHPLHPAPSPSRSAWVAAASPAAPQHSARVFTPLRN